MIKMSVERARGQQIALTKGSLYGEENSSPSKYNYLERMYVYLVLKWAVKYYTVNSRTFQFIVVVVISKGCYNDARAHDFASFCDI